MILNNDGILQDFASDMKTNLYKGYDYSNTDYYLAIKNGADDFWSKVYLSNATNKSTISYTLRVDENTIAVLIVDLDYLHKFTKKFKGEDDTSVVRITDKNGIFLSHPSIPEYVSQRMSIKDSNLYRKFIVNNQKEKQILFNGRESENNIGMYGISKNLGWIIVIKESYDIVFETFNTLMWFVIFLIVVLIILSLFLSIKLSKSVLLPLDIVSSNMTKIAHGKHIEDINTTEYLEFDKLVSNFLLMQDKINNRELKLKNFNKILKTRITEALEKNTKQLQILQQQSKMAQMGEMIGSIAHQWRQPLNELGINIQKLKYDYQSDNIDEEFIKHFIENNKKTIQFISKTIDDFRNFYRVDKEKEHFSIKKAVNDTITMQSSQLKNHNIALSLNGDDFTIDGYKNEFQQVMLNLLNNAKDALVESHTKTPFIDISLENHSIKVKDNGGGISKKIQNRVFEPYFTTKEQGKGTGIGLYMSKMIIEDNMGGTLSVSFSDGISIFKIDFNKIA